jgi:uncharacterized alkaline shock family protein YloU
VVNKMPQSNAKEPKGSAGRRGFSEVQGERGRVYISRAVMASLAEHAVSQVPTVAALQGGLPAVLSRAFGGHPHLVEVHLGQGGVGFTFHVILRYGQELYTAGAEIQRRVIEEVESITGVPVTRVDVYVRGIRYPNHEGPEESAEVESENPVLEAIAAHPEGIPLTGIGELLGVDWRRLIAPVNRLVEQGHVRKEGRLYFPTEGQ